MTDLLEGLNPQQQIAVGTVEGPVMVLAGPGSGKTRVLTHRVAYLVREAGIDPVNIVAVTFTNKAAREMAERLERLIGPQHERLTVGTFHAICARILRRHIHHLGYDNSFIIYDADDQQRVVKQVLKEMDLNDKVYRPSSIHAAISRAKNELQGPREFSRNARTHWEEVAGRIFERYVDKLQSSNAVDFDDLLLLTVRLFREAPHVLESYRNRWRFIHVDEFQDTNIVQYEIVKMLGEVHRNVFIVGDIDQGIYSWRGADYRNILRFEEDFPEVREVVLERNYRSTQTILDAATAVIRRNPNRKEKNLWTDKGKGPKITVFEAYNEQEEAEFIVREIRRLTARGRVKLSDCAVMYRTNAQSRAIEDAFVRARMPYVLVGGTRFYERREIKDVMAYLRLVHNPFDSISMERVINVPPRGIGQKSWNDLVSWAAQLGVPIYTALQVLKGEVEGAAGEAESPFLPDIPAPFAGRARSALLEFLDLLDGLIKARHERNVVELLDETIERIGYREYLRDGTSEGEERWENVLELRNVAAEYAFHPVETGLPAFLEEVALVSDVDVLARQSGRDAVTLMTLHTAKGLEFEAVFIAGMEENLFPHSRSQGDQEQMAEERRLAYVGITRAKERLYLLHTFRRTSYGRSDLVEPSRFLRDIPPLLIDRQGKREVGRQGTLDLGAGRSLRTGVESRRYASTARPSDAARMARRERTRQQRAGLEFKAGDKVRHAQFGEGIVISSQANGDDEEVTVAFPGHKPKRLLQSFANLQKI